MLEDRPIVQRSLIGFGAFSLVFAAAMGGTAFMISGGFGFGGAPQRAPPLQHYAAVGNASWNDWTSPGAPPPSAYVSAAAVEPNADMWYDTLQSAPSNTSEDLAGQTDAPAQSSPDDRSAEQAMRDVERELDAYQADAEQALTANAARQDAPYDPYVVAAKEQAAAGRNAY